MMYPYLTLDDETEITHSQTLDDGRVKVYIETPVDDGFHNATCYVYVCHCKRTIMQKVRTSTDDMTVLSCISLGPIHVFHDPPLLCTILCE